jgi:hypothetical protein
LEGYEAAMQRIAVGIVGVAGILLAAASVYVTSAGSHATDSSSQLVVNASPKERHALKLVDVAGCRDEVVAGQEKRLDSSSSRIERQELARQTDLVAKYCTCKFRETETFMTKREMVTQWLSASAGFSEPLPTDTRARLDQVVEECAQKYGLPTPKV